MQVGKHAPIVALAALSGALSFAPAAAEAQDLSLNPSVSSASSTAYLHDMFGKTTVGIVVCNEQHHNNWFHSNNIKHGCLAANGGVAEDIFKV